MKATIELKGGPFGEENHSARIEVLAKGNGLGTPDVVVDVLDYEAKTYKDGETIKMSAEEVNALLDDIQDAVPTEKVAAVREIVGGH